MIPPYKIFLIDGDVQRAAQVRDCLRHSSFHVEVAESTGEAISGLPDDYSILVHDAERAVAHVAAELSGAGDWRPIIAFAEQPVARRVVEATLGGAVDYLVWPFSGGELEHSLEVARPRAQVVGTNKLRESGARRKIEGLTAREREVLAAVASGLTNREIADELGISPRTVEIHRANLLNRMGVASTSEAIRIAVHAAFVG